MKYLRVVSSSCCGREKTSQLNTGLILSTDTSFSAMSNSNSNEITEWLDGFSQQQMQIWCEDPETNTEKIAGGVLGVGKTYVTYRILMKQVGRDIVGVRHRYSEFETLRNGLRDRYAPLGIAVPSLPPKTSMSNIISANLKQTFIKERIAGLTLFCELVSASPWLRNDKLWKEFMKPKASGSNSYSPSDAAPIKSSFASAFKSSTSAPTPVVYDSDNVGENKLISSLLQLEVPYKFTLTQRMEEVRIEIATIEKFVKIALERVRTMQTCERACASAQEGFLDSLSQWVAAEQASVRTMAGKTFDENKNVLEHPHEHALHSTTNMATLLKTKCGLSQHFPDYTGLGFATMLEQELAMVESIKELLRMHDEMVTGIDAISAKIVKTEASRSANKYEQVAEQRIILEERQASLTAFYKGFIYFTLPLCARQRAASLRKLTSIVAASDLTSAYALQVACIKFFSDINVKPMAAITEANRTFDLLKVKQLELIPEDITESMASPSLSPSNSHGFLNMTDSTSAMSISPASPSASSLSRGAVSLCPESSGMSGLFARAQAIGQQKGASSEQQVARRIIGGTPSSPAHNQEGGGNPLARRGSAVMKQQQQQQAVQSPQGGAAAGLGSSDSSSLMAEVPDDELSAYNIRPSEDVAVAPARVEPAGRLSPLKPSEKSQSLLADLMGGAGESSSGKKPASAASSSVWEDV